MQIFEQQQCNHGCPNLNSQGILAGTDKGFDLEMLFEGFVKDLYLPSVLVDIGDSRSTKFEVVGQQRDDAVVGFIPDNNPPEQMRTFFFSLLAGELNDLIGEYIAVLWNRTVSTLSPG